MNDGNRRRMPDPRGWGVVLPIVTAHVIGTAIHGPVFGYLCANLAAGIKLAEFFM